MKSVVSSLWSLAGRGGTIRSISRRVPQKPWRPPSRRPTTSIGNVGANCKAKHKSKEKGDRKKDNNASCEGMYGVQDHDP